MRVTQTLLSNQAVAALQANLGRLGQTQRHVATARRIDVPSDDPGAHAAAVRVDARRAGLDQLRRQAGVATDTLTATESVVASMSDLLARAQELAVSGADGAKGATERTAMATEIDGILEEIVGEANHAEDGRYLLGGRETQTAPLSVTRVAGQITAAAWNPRGVDGAVVIDVSEIASVQTNLGGTTVLGADTDPTFLPALLVSLRDALASNNPTAVNASLAGLQSAQARLAQAQATVGTRLRTLDHALGDLDTGDVAASARISALLDADMPRLAVELGRQQVVYQAALEAASKTIQPSLVEFLR